MAENKRSLTYKSAGVDIDAGTALVEAIKPIARSTARRGSDAALGGFGALFDLAAAGYRDPILVATTDGVGTKLKIAIAVGQHRSVGIDLVAMCVNDLVVQGAEPLFFLDYLATATLSVETGRAVIDGIGEGCRNAGCALIGGETAEMPGFYLEGDYDLAGFAVGAVERGEVVTGAGAVAGDLVLGLRSSGLHSNGFSLVRRLVADCELRYGEPAPFAPELSLGEALLTPTRIYVRSCLGAIRNGGVKALAHITGGGLIDNIPRVLPEALSVEIDVRTWDLPPIFQWVRREAGLSDQELARTFNCGIGMIAVVAADRAEEIAGVLRAAGETVSVIGRLTPAVASPHATTLIGCAEAWHS